MANTYDFYKPKLDSEYPEVDGPVSVVTYIGALDAAYTRFKEKLAKATKATKRAPLNGHINGLTNGHINGHINGHTNGEVIDSRSFSLDDVDHAIFHSPYGKQTVKAHARMLFNDFLANPSHPKFAKIPSAEALLDMSYHATLTDKNVEKTFIAAAKAQFAAQVSPSMACSRRLGNMYTASLYGCLASLVSSVEPERLEGKRVSLFAFGSGCASSFFTLRVKGDTSEMREKMDLLNRLASMKVVPCQEYVDALKVSFFLS
jgi:hydroxymethylglutaryl-CoA synthase